MDVLVSVVVPIYNVEQYLDRCIKSIVTQTYKNLEILLIDDGSPDTCPEICEEWAKKDSRIKVIHKENQGLGFARNTGIENATGDYICFFDSDDYVSEDLISLCVDNVKKYNSDIVTYGFLYIKGDKIIKQLIPNTPKDFYSNEEIKNFVLPNFIGKDLDNDNDYKLILSTSSSLFNLKLIKDNNFRFVSERDIISEDVYSLIALFSYVKSLSVISKPLYYYCRNNSSLTNTYRQDRFVKIKEFYYNTLSLLENLEYSELVKSRLIQQFISSTIGAIKLIVFCCDSKMSTELLSDILNDELFTSSVKQYNTKHESFSRKVLFLVFRTRSAFLLKLLVRLKGD